jgi:hypothetical protein
MNNFNLSKFAKTVQTVIADHSPEILTGIGIAGMLTTTVLAVRATPKALRLIDDEKKKQNDARAQEAYEKGVEAYDYITKLPVRDVVKTCWKCYIPTVVTGVMSTACLIGASSVNAKRNTALAAAYSISETALKEYQEKVVETIGEKKEQVVRDAVAKEKIDKDPVTNREVIITENGNTLCYAVVSGRYFKSDIDKLKKAENDLNRRMRDDMYISLNEFYYEIGLDSISIGDDLGWNIDRGYVDLEFSAQLAADGTPCVVVSYGIAPRYDYRNLM